jgi:hypothetical protein
MRTALEYAALAASAAIGVWLLAAPELFGIDGPARISLLVVGPIAAAAAVIAMSAVVRLFVRVNIVLGAWLIVAAFLLDHDGRWYVSAVAGGLLAVLALVPRGRAAQFGGGWTALIGSNGGWQDHDSRPTTDEHGR